MPVFNVFTIDFSIMEILVFISILDIVFSIIDIILKRVLSNNMI